MRFLRSSDFTGQRAWQSELLADFGDVTAKLHWTDQPFHWHANTGPEVFAVMDGEVEMHYRVGGEERRKMMRAGDVFSFSEGDEHVAHPNGAARVLVVELRDSD